jgi:hypothetical protein
MLATATPMVAQGAILPLDDIERGQRGWGLSVFEGTEPERFEFEVIGVWRNVQPETSYILARFSGRGLEETGVIAGMSGSPVYIDDRLVGAVAFAWPFSKEPVGGITPIESMRKLLGAEPMAAAGASAVRAANEPVDLSRIVEHDLDQQSLIDELARLRPRSVGDARSGLQWLSAGFGPESRRLLSAGLGNLASAGVGRSATASAELPPGGSVSAVLIEGDLNLAATGTVTDRIDEQVLAFGHSFLGLGPLAVPMATSEVVTVLSNQANSFKVANLGEVVGAFEFDHSAGIRGRMGAVAPMVPVQVRLMGREQQMVNVRLASLPELAPTLFAITILGSLEVDPEAAGSRSIDMAVRYDLGSNGPLQMRQSFDGPAAPIEMALHVFAITGYLMQNHLEEVEVGSIELDVSWTTERRGADLIGAHASRTKVRPGESVELTAELISYRGEPFRRSLLVELPPDLPAGRMSLLIGDGVSVDAARLSIERAVPIHLRQALGLLGSLHSRRELQALGMFPGQGLAVAGEAMPRLPGSVRSLWGAAPTAGAVPLQMAVTGQVGIELDQPLNGLVRVDLEVERPQPWNGSEGVKNNNGRPQ